MALSATFTQSTQETTKRLNPPMEWFPWDYLYKICSESQRMAKVPNGMEILPKISTR